MDCSQHKLQHEIDVSSLLVNPKREMMPVLKSLPGWTMAEPTDVHITQISGALTNLIYRCQHVPSGEYVLARVFGTSGVLFDREEEQQIFAAVAHAGLGPKLLANFENGRIEEFLLDQSITASQMRTPPVATCIAAALAIFNFTRLTLLPQKSLEKPICWERTRKWARAVQKLFTPEELRQEGLDNVLAEIDALEEGFTSGGALPWLGFCHNDTQYGNMLLHTASKATLSSCPDAHDFLDAQSSLDEQSFVEGAAGLQGKLSVMAPGHERPAFSVERGRDVTATTSEPWSFERPADLDESQGGSPRKHPRGLTFFQELLEKSPEPRAAPEDTELRLSVRLIDYEYAGTNPVAFDIGNHWCEYAANYHGPEPHRLDYAKFPSLEQQLRFTRAYVAAVLALRQRKQEQGLPSRADSLVHSLAAAAASGSDSRQQAPQSAAETEQLAEKLRESAVGYVPVSHLQWGIWGLLQARLSDVPSFDFMEYGRQRLRQWKLLQPAFSKI